MNQQKQPQTWAIRADEVTVAQLEHIVRSMGVQLRATQLDGDSVRIKVQLQKWGDVYLASASSNQVLLLDWEARPGSVNLSICVNAARLLLEGRIRQPASMVVYSAPSAVWAGQWLPGNPGDKIYHFTLPGEAAVALGLPAHLLWSGCFEVPLPASLAVRVCDWLDHQLEHDPGEGDVVPDELSGWVKELLGQVGAHPEVVPPSHYSRIIRALGDQCEFSSGPLSVARLAGEIHVSTRTVQRAFHSTLGVGAKRYLRVRQLRRARELLAAGDCSVSHAAHAVGFPHTSRFSQEYFAHFGVYPSETIATAAQAPLDETLDAK